MLCRLLLDLFKSGFLGYGTQHNRIPFCIFLWFLWGMFHVVCPRKCVEKRNVFQLGLFHTLDVSVPVNNSSFSREMAELVFKLFLISIKHKYT